MEPMLTNLKWHQPIEGSTQRIGEYQWADLSTVYQVVEALLGCGILHDCYCESHIPATVKSQIPCRLRIHTSLSLVSVYAIFFPCFFAQILETSYQTPTLQEMALWPPPNLVNPETHTTSYQA